MHRTLESTSINLPQYTVIINTNCYIIKEQFNTNRGSIDQVLGLFLVTCDAKCTRKTNLFTAAHRILDTKKGLLKG